tara:strand:+ start:1467 stop:1601 length:135 start_codon:yes stop_codon:yes gene_type:complete
MLRIIFRKDSDVALDVTLTELILTSISIGTIVGMVGFAIVNYGM